MQRKKSGKEMKSFVPTIFLLTIITECLVLGGFAIANYFVLRESHYIFDVAIFTLATIMIGSLVIIMYKLLNHDILTHTLNKDAVTFHIVMLFITKKLHKYTSFYVNIKDFKYINRIHSSKIGDIVLRKYCDAIRSYLSNDGFIARLGGDNFLILVKSEKANEILSLLERIDVEVVKNGKTEYIPVYSRCGVKILDEASGVSDVFEHPNIAFTAAKALHSDYYCYYKDSMSKAIYEEQEISTTYHSALENNEFVIYFQPKINTDTNTIYGAEALVRWNKNGEIIAPYKFIPVMERLGLIPELDFYVFEKVCQTIKDWELNGIEPVTISSNFSNFNLKNESFVERVDEIIRKYDVDRKYIRIEFTESAEIEDHKTFLDYLEKLCKINISTSIDDFGIGYSSLSLAINDNVTSIKLDKSFIDNIVTDNNDAFLVEMIINASKRLNKSIVCEGVETKEQLDLLKSFGCNQVQGYYFDKPMPLDQFVQKLKNPKYED